MDTRIYLKEQRLGPLFHRKMDKKGAEVRAAFKEAAMTAANEIEARGADDIEAAGNFGDRWTEGLHADVRQGGGNIRIDVYHDIPYWTIFEFGGDIQGKPLLWIPFEFAGDAKEVWARNYPGSLFRVDRKSDGLPLLLSSEDKQPKYFGKESVHENQKFHIREISRQVAKELPEYFRDALR